MSTLLILLLAASSPEVYERVHGVIGLPRVGA
jgi:hypothetical protein